VAHLVLGFKQSHCQCIIQNSSTNNLGLVARESVKIDNKVLQKKEFDRQWYRVWKWCEIEQGADEEISGMTQNVKTEETVWLPKLSSSECTEVLQYPWMQCYKEEICSNEAY